MIDKNIIQTISEKEMDRKDFLKYSGLALLSVAGLKTVASFLSDNKNTKTVNKETTSGFGSGKYGA